MKFPRNVCGFCWLILLLLGCPSFAEQPGPVVLNTWDIPSEGDSLQRPVWSHFRKTRPHIQFRLTRGIEVEEAGSTSALLLAMAGNTAPDFFYVSLERIPTFARQNFLYPLNELVTTNQVPWLETWIMPQVKEALGGDGKIGALPFFYTKEGLWYRKDLFQKAGLDATRAPKDWNELYEYARALTIPEEGQSGFCIGGGASAGYLFISFVWAAGGELMRQVDGTHNYRSAFQERPGVLALNFYKKLRWSVWSRCPDDKAAFDVDSVDIESGAFTPHPYPRCPVCGRTFKREELEQAKKLYTGVVLYSAAIDPLGEIRDGKLAMTIGVSQGELVLPSELDPNLIGIAPLPGGPGGRPVFKINAGCYAINGQLRDPKRIAAAWEYITYLASDEAKAIRVRALIQNGYGRQIDPHWLESFGYREHVKRVPDDWRGLAASFIQFGKAVPSSEGFLNIMHTELPFPVQSVLFAKAEQVRSMDSKKLLDEAAQESDRRHLGAKDPKTFHDRRLVALVTVGLVFLALAWCIIAYVRLTLRRQGSSAENRGLVSKGIGPRQHTLAWLFMAPALLSVVLWQYLPLVLGTPIAFMDYRIAGQSLFVGLDNFIEVLWNPRFWHSLGITVYFVGLTMIFTFIPPILVALLLAEVPKGKYLFRTLLYLPAMISSIVLLVMWKSFYDPSPSGLLNVILFHVGLGPVGWLNDPHLAMWCVVLPAAWAGAGPGSLIYLAALKTIPEEFYEAADVDGAGVMKKISQVTLPMLKPLLLINFLGTLIGSFQSMGNILPLTAGGPHYATNVVGMEIWRSAFLFLQFGYATALAWILASLLIGIVVYQLHVLQQVEFKQAGNDVSSDKA